MLIQSLTGHKGPVSYIFLNFIFEFFLLTLAAEGDQGEFRFEFNDGVMFSDPRTFRIQSRLPTLSMTSRGPLKVFPGVDQPITSHILRAITDAVVQSRPIIYTVVSGPKRGQLRVKNGRDATSLTSFTQHEVDGGTIIYRPLVDAAESPWTGIIDAVVLEVSTAYATSLRDVTLPVNISFVNLNADNVHVLITLLPLRAKESGVATVNQDHIDARSLLGHLAMVGVSEIVYKVVEAPQHGRLSVGRGNNAISGYRLSRRAIIGNDVMYVHDNSDTTSDYFRFAVELHAVGNEVVGIDHVITVNVTIQPKNDEKFKLMTEKPELEVLQVTSFSNNNRYRDTVCKATSNNNSPPLCFHFDLVNSNEKL